MRSSLLALALLTATALSGCAAQPTIGPRSRAASVQGSHPVLAWVAPPVASRSDLGPVCYDLRVWSAVGGYPRSLVYSATGVRGTHHCVVPELWPGDYVWTVRARYRIGGRPRATAWSAVGKGLCSGVVPRRNYHPLRVIPSWQPNGVSQPTRTSDRRRRRSPAALLRSRRSCNRTCVSAFETRRSAPCAPPDTTARQ